MIFINLDRKSKISLFKQIFFHLKDLIEREVLQPGYRMPSTRLLAEKLCVSRSTVVEAYEELWAFGYLDSRPGSYSIIRKRKNIASQEQKSGKGYISWENVSSPQAKKIYETYQNIWSYSKKKGKNDLIKMSGLSLDLRLFPSHEFRKCMNTVFFENMSDIYNYSAPQGYKPFREFLAKRLQIHGISVSPGEILITNGSQNSIELILKLLTVPGSKIVVEDPTYFLIHPLLKFYNVDIIGSSMKDDGVNLDQLQHILKMHNPSFLYTIPNFHNPTGITTNQMHREKLLSICEKYKLPIVEDAFEEEMKYFGKVPLPIKSMDKGQIVIYLGSFSKVLFPGIRIGWIAAEKECVRRLVSIKNFSDITSNLPVQAALSEFCHRGYYDLHIKRIHRIYRKRMQVALKSLKRYLCFEKVSWIEPTGGFLIWIKMKDTGKNDGELNRIFLENGVRVSPGEHFFTNKNSNHYIRLSISTLEEEEIKEGIKRIGNALSFIY